MDELQRILKNVQSLKLHRREFIKKSIHILLYLYFGRKLFAAEKEFHKKLFSKKTTQSKKTKLTVVKGKNVDEMLKIALKEKIKKLVKKNSKIFIKPNAAFPRTPKQAANTNPEIIKSLGKILYEAGAAEVLLSDNPAGGHYSITYRLSGIEDAAKEANIKIIPPIDKNFVEVKNRDAKIVKSVYIMKDIFDSDVFINVPVAKVHSEAVLTLSMKNLIGATLKMGELHTVNLHQAIADLSLYIKPSLIIVDATRILLTNGPSGPGKVEELNTIIIGEDPVAVDSYTAETLFGIRGADVPHIKIASEMGLGEIDLGKMEIQKIELT
jgi:uncharacterized protein (DUF362 family)